MPPRICCCSHRAATLFIAYSGLVIYTIMEILLIFILAIGRGFLQALVHKVWAVLIEACSGLKVDKTKGFEKQLEDEVSREVSMTTTKLPKVEGEVPWYQRILGFEEPLQLTEKEEKFSNYIIYVTAIMVIFLVFVFLVRIIMDIILLVGTYKADCRIKEALLKFYLVYAFSTCASSVLLFIFFTIATCYYGQMWPAILIILLIIAVNIYLFFVVYFYYVEETEENFDYI